MARGLVRPQAPGAEGRRRRARHFAVAILLAQRSDGGPEPAQLARSARAEIRGGFGEFQARFLTARLRCRGQSRRGAAFTPRLLRVKESSAMTLYRRVIGYYRPYLGTIAFSMILLVIGVNFSLLKYWPDPVGDRSCDQGRADRHGALGGLRLLALPGRRRRRRSHGRDLFPRGPARVLAQLRLDRGGPEGAAAVAHATLLVPCNTCRFISTTSGAAAIPPSAWPMTSQAVQTYFNRGFDTIFGSAITLLTTFAYMVKMDWLLALISLCILPPLWCTIYLFSARVRRQTTALQQEESDVLARASEGLTSIRIVHAFGQEEFEVREFEREGAAELRGEPEPDDHQRRLDAARFHRNGARPVARTDRRCDPHYRRASDCRRADTLPRLRRHALPAVGATKLYRVGAGGRGSRHAARV